MGEATWGDIIAKVLEPYGRLELSDIYRKVRICPETSAKSKNPKKIQHIVRAIIRSDGRFKRVSRGFWALVPSVPSDKPSTVAVNTKRVRAEEHQKVENERRRKEIYKYKVLADSTKLKRYRMRQETAIWAFFEGHEAGNNATIVKFVNKDYKNCYGRVNRQAEISSKECSQLMKRMGFAKVNDNWTIPERVKSVSESLKSEDLSESKNEQKERVDYETYGDDDLQQG